MVNAPANFQELIGLDTDGITWLFDASSTFDALFVFAITKADLHQVLTHLASEISAKTICWIFYPKAKTSLGCRPNLMQSWEDLKSFQLTPCGSAAIDKIWTAIRIKPINELKRSGLGNAEIQQNDYGQFIDIKNKLITLPADVETAISADPAVSANFQKLAYSHKKNTFMDFICQTRKNEIRPTV